MVSSFIEVYNKYLETNPKFPGKVAGMPAANIQPCIDKYHNHLKSMDTLADFVKIAKDDVVCILLRDDTLLQTYLKVILNYYGESSSIEDLEKVCEIFYHLHFTSDDVNWLLSEINFSDKNAMEGYKSLGRVLENA